MRMQLSQRDGKAIIRDRGETLPPAPSQGLHVSFQYLFSMLNPGYVVVATCSTP